MKKWVVLVIAAMMVAGAVQAKEKGKSKSTVSDVTKAAFIAAEQKKAEATGTAFDQATAEAAFAAKDKNSDSVLTADEQTPAGKGAKKLKQKKAE